MKCSVCNKHNEDGVNFCNHCGAKLKGNRRWVKKSFNDPAQMTNWFAENGDKVTVIDIYASLYFNDVPFIGGWVLENAEIKYFDEPDENYTYGVCFATGVNLFIFSAIGMVNRRVKKFMNQYNPKPTIMKQVTRNIFVSGGNRVAASVVLVKVEKS